MRRFRLQQEGEENWKIFLGPNEIASFTSKNITELKGLQGYLSLLYPDNEGDVNLIINLPEQEIEIPRKGNVSDNPMNPSNSWSYILVGEDIMEAALYRLIDKYQDEFGQNCEDIYKDRCNV